MHHHYRSGPASLCIIYRNSAETCRSRSRRRRNEFIIRLPDADRAVLFTWK